MNRKISLIVCFVLVFTGIGICLWKVPRIKEKTIPFLDHELFQDIEKEEITSITVQTITEGGIESEEILSKEEILSTYRYFAERKIGEEVTTRCEDNSKIYTFHFVEKEDIMVTIECDWIIIEGKAYHWI